jgi:hypothetical protein
MDGIALPLSDVSEVLIEQHGLQRLIHDRGGEREIQFLRRVRQPILPVWHDGQLRIVAWGGQPPSRCGLTWLRTLEAGDWQPYEPEAVDIPAAAGLERGVWFRIRQGVRGLLVDDRAFVLIEPSTHYYRVMTKSRRMPLLIGEQI